MRVPSLTLSNPLRNPRPLSAPPKISPSPPLPRLFSSDLAFKTSPRPAVAVQRRNARRRSTAAACGEAEGAGPAGRDDEDGLHMRRCVELARKAVGCTSPNPMVGCVVVKDGVVVGEGFHPQAGQPHAEVFALRNAGKHSENATAYVTLEPCNHYGRTPPCTEALINAKVTRVVVGMVDPNPIVASKGVERLRQSGISVTVGVEEMSCKKLNEAYIHKMLTGKPFVTLRYSSSMHGGIVQEIGKKAKELGGYYSKMLQETDGLVISSSYFVENTWFPSSNETNAKQPLFIIIANNKSSPLHIPSFPTESGKRAVVFVDKDTVIEPTTEYKLKQQGVEVVVFDHINLHSILDYCSRQGMCSILLDISNDDGRYDDVFKDVEVDVQKVIMEISPARFETKNISALKLGGKILKIKDIHSRTVKQSILVEGYIA